MLKDMKQKAKQGNKSRLFLLSLLGVVLLVEAGFLANFMLQHAGPGFLAAVVQSEIISMTNTERTDLNVGQLTENTKLDAAAEAKAKDMAAKGYFSHNGPDGKTPWQWIAGTGYNYQYAGENLAVRFSDSRDVVNAWMASPTHRANIAKGQYKEIGVGIADGTYEGQPATFVVQYFGSPDEVGVTAAPKKITQTTPVQTTPKPVPTAAPQVAGAEAPTPVVESAPAKLSWLQSVGQHLIALYSLVVQSLPASVADSDMQPVIIGTSGASTSR